MTPTPNQTPVQPTFTLSGEWRFCSYDSMTFEAKAGKPARTINRVVHTIEVDSQTLALTEVLPDGLPMTSYVLPAGVVKGATVNVGVLLEPAKVLQVVNGRAQESRGLWRVRVLSVSPAMQPGKK